MSSVNVDHPEVATVIADLDDLLTALYVFADGFLPRRDQSRPGRKPRISDAEVICLAVAQVLLDCPKERRFLRFARRRLGHLFGYIPGQSGFNKRVRALAPEIAALLGYLARISPSWCDGLRLIDATGRLKRNDTRIAASFVYTSTDPTEGTICSRAPFSFKTEAY